MSNLFTSVSFRKPKKSKFDLSHERKMSLKMGTLTPIMVQPILPGDSFKVKSEIFMRLATMLAPVMHRINVYTHFFFVPNRIVWNEWEDFITGGKDGTLQPVFPYLRYGEEATKAYFEIKTLADYMGVPTIASGAAVVNWEKLSALPFRAYQQIYNDYFRDQNLTDEIDFSKSSGEMSGGEWSKLMTMRKRAWPKDYFTSALPFSQRGPEVKMELEIDYEFPATAKNNAGAAAPAGNVVIGASGVLTSSADTLPIAIENIEGTSFTINDLRKSVRLQEWLEKNARGGARYVEQLLSHFGITNYEDARLQRAEWLGGGKTPISISEVLSNAAPNETSTDMYPLGTMGGHGIAASGINGFQKKFTELVT